MNDRFFDSGPPEWIDRLPEQFHVRYVGLEVWRWLGLALLLLVAWVAVVLGRWLAIRLMRARERRRPGEITAETHRAVRRASGLLCGVVVCYPLLGPLTLPPKLDNAVLVVLEAVTLLALAMLTYAIWDVTCDAMASKAAGVSKRAERLLVPLTRKFVRAIIVLVFGFVALSFMFHVNVAAVITSLGIGGLIIALAGKDSVENIFGSVTILFDMPFAIGDRIAINNIEGIVEEINLRSTRIRTFEDTMVTLPNSNLIRTTVENWSSRRYRRVRLTVRVPFEAPAAKVELFCKDLRHLLTRLPNVDADRVIVNLNEIDDTGLLVLVQCYVQAGGLADEMEIRHKVLAEVAKLRAKHLI